MICITASAPAESIDFSLRRSKDDRKGEYSTPAQQKTKGDQRPAAGDQRPGGKTSFDEQKSINAQKNVTRNSIEEYFLSVTPLLTPGTQSQLLVVDSLGVAQSGVSVVINDQTMVSDAGGRVSFAVPDSVSLDIAIPNQASKRNKQVFRRKGDYLVSDNSADLAQLLANLKSEFSGSKRLAYLLWAPSLVSPDSNFVLLGEGFSPQMEQDKVFVDGKQVPVVAAGKNCILARLPEKTSLGPVRDLSVEVDGKASNSVELDVCEPYVDCPRQMDPEGAPVQGFIGVRGTNMPAALKLTNNNMEAVSVWMLSQNPMKQVGRFLTPGGERNSVSLGFLLSQKYAEPSFSIELIPEIAGLPEEHESMAALRRRLAETQVERLNKRLLVVKAQIEECRKKIERSDSDASQYELRALSLRKSVLGQMLAGRKALMLALGGTVEDYKAALERSAGGAYATVDAHTGPVILAPEKSTIAVVPSVEPADTRTAATTSRVRLHRLIEPKIKLLPPPEAGSAAPPPESQPKTLPEATSAKPADSSQQKKAAETKSSEQKKTTPPKDQKKTKGKTQKPQQVTSKGQRVTRSSSSRSSRSSARRSRRRR